MSLIIFKIHEITAKEANSQSQKTCRPGPDEYMKCMTRELFFVCIFVITISLD